MRLKTNARILKPRTEYIIDYPQAVAFAEEQGDIFWTPTEIKLEKDVHDLLTGLTEAELHGVTTVLKLFTKYELMVGSDYWSGRMKRIFKRPDIERMCNAFSYMEINVHAPFYSKINELLGLDTEEFYNSYTDDPTLKDRMDWIESVVATPINTEYDILKSVGAFSMVEGAILYSSFGFLKHFQAEGKNKLNNMVSGMNFSVRDENLHSLGGAWIFKQTLEESSLTKHEKVKLQDEMEKVAHGIVRHEEQIVKKIFEKGNITGTSDLQLNNFVQHRNDLCLQQLGYNSIFKPTYDPISKWFYKNITASHMQDFFHRKGNSYNRDWDENAFEWKTLDEVKYGENNE